MDKKDKILYFVLMHSNNSGNQSLRITLLKHDSFHRQRVLTEKHSFVGDKNATL